MQKIIHGPSPTHRHAGQKIELPADRATLAKRRWHGRAEDGAEFGFDLEEPLSPGTIFHETDAAHYVLKQKPEEVLEVALKETASAAQVAWSLGNLHFQIELDGNTLRVAADPAVRLYFERAGIPFEAAQRVFRPIKATAHSHGHHHGH